MGKRGPRFDLTGLKTHNWEVLRFSHIKPPRVQYWWARCGCGVEKAVAAQALRQGLSKSCGCLKGAAIAKARTTHGVSDHPLYVVWGGMKARCTRERYHAFHNYGGAGVSVCARWLDFSNFFNDMITGWRPGLQLDRIDPFGDYEPANVRWATRLEQGANRRKTVMVEFEGEMVATSALARRFGVPAPTVLGRYKSGKRGRSLIEKAP